MEIIIILEKYGGYCNRLFQSLHYHAYAIEHSQIFLNPSMLGLLRFDNDYFYLFDKFRNTILFLLAKIIKMIFKNNEINLLIGKKYRIKIESGWVFRADDLTEKHYQVLKKNYQFKNYEGKKKAKYIKSFLKKEKEKGKFLVGFHLRKGDYKYWNKGRFFFDDNFYIEAIFKIKKSLIKENKDPYIIGVSDEKINLINGIDFYIKGAWKDDQWALQNCDLIIGPPSTFTMWASFISEIPLIQLNSIDDLKLENQKICKG